MSLTRKELTDSLNKKQWFKKTSAALRKELLSLPDDCDGFITDLANRPEESGNVKTIRLIKLLVGNYILTPVFEVEAIQTKQKFTFEYSSWKNGTTPAGCRGIIFLEDEGEIKYFIVRRSDRFSLSKTIYDAVASAYSETVKNSNLTISNKLEKQLNTIIDSRAKIDFKRIIDLGIIYPDSGMSNVTVQLFAAIIDVSGKSEEIIRHLKSKKFDPYIIRWDMDIFPISDLMGFVNKTDDSFLLSTISRVISRGIVHNL